MGALIFVTNNKRALDGQKQKRNVQTQGNFVWN